MDNNIKCNLCNGTSLDLLYGAIKRDGSFYDIYKCRGCGLGITWPIPARTELESIYSSENYRAHEKRFIFPIEQISRYLRGRRLAKINKYSAKGQILDIGCGRGIMLSLAKKRGWKTFGLEFNSETAFHAKEVIGLDIRTGNIKNSGFEASTFDAITIWHVLEHLENPSETISECNRLLKPEGVLVISVPNLQSIQSRISGKHWFHLDVPCHLYHFSEKNLSQMLISKGFSIEEVNYFSWEQSIFGFIQSLFNMSGVTNNFLYDTLKSKQLRKDYTLASNLKNILLTILLLSPIFLFSILLTGLEVLLRRGGEVAVYAKKKE